MGTISDYLNGIQKKYPDTQAVREQLEELRDTLHLKAEDLQAQGLLYEDASRKAITDLGDITPLLDQVSGNVKTIYVNRINRDNARLCTLFIVAEFLLGWLGFLLFAYPNRYTGYFFLSVLLLGISISIWPIIASVTYKRDPDKVAVTQMPYKKLLHTALLAWAAISVLLFFINVFVPQSGAWFMWPVIGISNWPLNIWLYHRQLISGRYDAPERA